MRGVREFINVCIGRFIKLNRLESQNTTLVKIKKRNYPEVFRD